MSKFKITYTKTPATGTLKGLRIPDQKLTVVESSLERTLESFFADPTTTDIEWSVVPATIGERIDRLRRFNAAHDARKKAS